MPIPPAPSLRVHADDDSTRQYLADLLATAAAELAAPPLSTPHPWTLLGVPVTAGRLHLGRQAHLLGAGTRCAVAVTFDGVCWLGAGPEQAPARQALTHSTLTSVDGRGRVTLPRSVRTWLAVPDPDRFQVVLAPVPDGLYVVPTHEVHRRLADLGSA